MKKLLLVLTIFCMILPSCKKTTITLSVDKTEISADGIEVAKFKVIDNKDENVTKEARIFFSDTNKEVGGTTFSTTEPKTYSFYATYDDATSEKVTITATKVNDEGDEGDDDNEEEGPIVLSASTDTIMANGIDAVSFTVMQDTVDVTSLTEIFANEELIEGNVFSTEKAGTYTIIAKKNDAIVSNEITIIAIEYKEPENPITLTASTDTITADGVDVITFTAKQNNTDITDKVEIYVNGNKIEGKKFSTNTAGEYKAYAKKDNITSNEISFIAKEVPAEPEKPIELTATPTTIFANGEDAVTFTVTQDNKDVTSETEIFVNDNKISGNKFTSTTVGTYKAYAKKGELKSNEINIVVTEVPVEPEKPIELKADKTNMKANGVDMITFTVMQEGNDVTSQSEIFVDGSRLNGNKYCTYTVGTHTVYAKKNEAVSNEITITAEQVSGGTTTLFAEGVTPTSGWYDSNKIGSGDTNGDANMCWAATASNIIQWWQDRYVAAGNTLPQGAITGEGTTYELALMEMFHEQWDNAERGSDPTHGVIWYFEGKNIWQNASEGSFAQPKTGYDGGYFKNEWNEILNHVYHEYTHISGYNNLIAGEFNNYTNWYKDENWQDLTDSERIARFSNLLITFMERGICGLSVAGNASLSTIHHSVTLWGCEYDNATGLVTKIWITDSDDMKTEPKHPVIHECTVSLEQGRVKFEGAAYTYYAVALFPVSGYGSL